MSTVLRISCLKMMFYVSLSTEHDELYMGLAVKYSGSWELIWIFHELKGQSDSNTSRFLYSETRVSCRISHPILWITFFLPHFETGGNAQRTKSAVCGRMLGWMNAPSSPQWAAKGGRRSIGEMVGPPFPLNPQVIKDHPATSPGALQCQSPQGHHPFFCWLVAWNIFFHSVGNVIIPTDFHSIIFQRGCNHQPVCNVQYLLSIVKLGTDKKHWKKHLTFFRRRRGRLLFKGSDGVQPQLGDFEKNKVAPPGNWKT